MGKHSGIRDIANCLTERFSMPPLSPILLILGRVTTRSEYDRLGLGTLQIV